MSAAWALLFLETWWQSTSYDARAERHGMIVSSSVNDPVRFP